jgi:hypothetical protein
MVVMGKVGIIDYSVVVIMEEVGTVLNKGGMEKRKGEER